MHLLYSFIVVSERKFVVSFILIGEFFHTETFTALNIHSNFLLSFLEKGTIRVKNCKEMFIAIKTIVQVELILEKKIPPCKSFRHKIPMNFLWFYFSSNSLCKFLFCVHLIVHKSFVEYIPLKCCLHCSILTHIIYSFSFCLFQTVFSRWNVSDKCPIFQNDIRIMLLLRKQTLDIWNNEFILC